MSRLRQRQDGMVLIVTLAMLVVITLFVISMIRLGNTNATIVGNMQAQKGVEAEAQQAIEMAVSKYSFFDDAIQETNTWSSFNYAFAWYSAVRHLHADRRDRRSRDAVGHDRGLPAAVPVFRADDRLQRAVGHRAAGHLLGYRRGCQRCENRRFERDSPGPAGASAGR